MQAKGSMAGIGNMVKNKKKDTLDAAFICILGNK